MSVFTVDQAFRIKSNRSLLRRPVAALAGAAADSSETGVESLKIHCECSAQHCTATLVVIRSIFERIRPERGQLLVAVGHELDSPVHVSLRTETYELVEPWLR